MKLLFPCKLSERGRRDADRLLLGGKEKEDLGKMEDVDVDGGY